MLLIVFCAYLPVLPFVFQVVLAEGKAEAVCGLHAEELSSRLQVSGLCTKVHGRVL